MVKKAVSIGCHPKDFVNKDDSKNRWGIVADDRKLTEKSWMIIK